MTTLLRVHAIFEKHGSWYVGYVPEMPGVNAQEKTLRAARRSLLAALRDLVDLNPGAVSPKSRRIEEVELRV